MIWPITTARVQFRILLRTNPHIGRTACRCVALGRVRRQDVEREFILAFEAPRRCEPATLYHSSAMLALRREVPTEFDCAGGRSAPGAGRRSKPSHENDARVA